ncbi:thioredoxin 2 [Paramecium bursaria]
MQDYKLTIKTQDDWKNQVLASQVPVIVQFTASWCGPCQKQKPILEKFVSESAGKLKLAYADVDIPDLGDIADDFKIQSLPGLMEQVS